MAALKHGSRCAMKLSVPGRPKIKGVSGIRRVSSKSKNTSVTWFSLRSLGSCSAAVALMSLRQELAICRVKNVHIQMYKVMNEHSLVAIQSTCFIRHPSPMHKWICTARSWSWFSWLPNGKDCSLRTFLFLQDRQYALEDAILESPEFSESECLRNKKQN